MRKSTQMVAKSYLTGFHFNCSKKTKNPVRTEDNYFVSFFFFCQTSTTKGKNFAKTRATFAKSGYFVKTAETSKKSPLRLIMRPLSAFERTG